MKYLIQLNLLLLIMVSVLCSGCQNNNNFTFVVAADPQLFRGKPEDLDKAVESINEISPDFVIMCGDLVENPSNEKQIQAYKNSVSKLSSEIKLYNLAGNHDLGRPYAIKHVNTYNENFGKLWYHFTRGKNLFIMLSSDILQISGSPMEKEQIDWLKETLIKYQSKPVNNKFVFMHHPLYLKSPDEENKYANMPADIRMELLELFKKYDVSAVFSGHHHDNRINRWKNIDLITTNSITVPLGKTPAGFRLVEVNSGGYKHTYYTIEELQKVESAK